MRELETSVRQLEGRCSDLRDAAAGHDQRAKDTQAEVLKGNHIIEKLTVGEGGWGDVRPRHERLCSVGVRMDFTQYICHCVPTAWLISGVCGRPDRRTM